ncbi:bifunctional DNA primase/polymerase [Deinococcus ficus]|uniref:bifunctional DNA primase/polymerase n=1 Tax=Deinococcus ficus TaxID=317577 RepID=UPI0003FDD7FF|nr:bifunctional DNA primase/polymerase [Deinococcus ficus]
MNADTITAALRAAPRTLGEHAYHYTSVLGFGVTPTQGKRAYLPNWNSPENALRDPQSTQAHFERTNDNIGLVHAASGTATFDVDNEEYMRKLFAEFGRDWDKLKAQSPYRIRGQKGEKPLFLIPEGVTLRSHKLVITCPKTGKKVTVCELRTGQMQDLLPPSIHPITKEPYVWVNGPPRSRDDIPVLSGELLDLWLNWEAALPLMLAALGQTDVAPQAHVSRTPTESHEELGNESVIELFNTHHTPGEVLERNGYTRSGNHSWVFPDSTTGSAGVHLLPDSRPLRVYSHHQADPLCTEHGHDAFSVFTILEHGGNLHQAVKAAAQELGLPFMKKSNKPGEASHEGRPAGNHSEPRISKGTRALQLVLDKGEPWRDDAGQAYITVPGKGCLEHHRLSSRGAKDYVGDLFFDSEERMLGGPALSEVIDALSARARRSGQVYPTGQRVKHWQGKSYLDLGREDWLIVAVEDGDWHLVPAADCPVRFTRSPQMKALPLPERGGSLGQLSELLNTDRKGLILCTAFLLGALSARGPYPHLAFKGEQGVGKSTAASTLQRLIDPSTANRRRAPRKEQDLFIAARSSHVLSFDNLSSISADLSDSLCALSTGGAFATRTLHTNDEETVLQAMRPAILNGIADLLTRADLAERTLLVELQRIDASQRLTEQALEERFTDLHPQLLGALLTALAVGLQNLEQTHLERPPRLADFARLIVAAEPALPWEPGDFLQVYADMQEEAARVILEGDDLAQALRTFLDERRHWEGPINLLLNLLNEQEGLMAGYSRPAVDWPRNPRALGERLRRLAPPLSKTGYATTYMGRRKGGMHYRLQKVQV